MMKDKERVTSLVQVVETELLKQDEEAPYAMQIRHHAKILSALCGRK